MPLIPAQEVDALLDQQRNANQPTQADPRVLAGIFSQSHQLQMAQAMRQRQNGGNAPAMANAPLADHMRQAKAAGTQGLPQPVQPQQHDFSGQAQQPQNPQAGTMSVAASGHNPMSAQGMYNWAQVVKHDQQAQGNQSYTLNVQQGPDVYNPQTDANKGNLIHEMMQKGQGAEINNMVPGPNRVQGFSVGGGAMAGGGQPQQQADPIVQALSAYKGKLPDDVLQRAGAAINAGTHAPTVLSELEKMVQQGGTRSEAAKDKEAARTEYVAEHHQDQQLRQLQHQQQMLMGVGDKAGSDALQPQIDQIMNPPQPPVINDPSQLGQVSAGQTVVHNGRLLRRKS